MNGTNSLENTYIQNENQGLRLQIFIIILTAFPLWLPLVLLLSFQVIAWMNGNDFSEVYEKNWGIELSKKWQEACHKKSDTGFHGDGERYSVYENVSESSITDMNIPFMRGKNEELVEEFRFVTEALEITGENQPDFAEDFVWARLSKEDGSYLVVLFFPEEEKLFLAQAFF